MIEQRRELLNFALQLAKAAEEQILPYYRRCAVSLKADGTEVTEADRRAETVMREMIIQRFPLHTILGEEFGCTVPSDSAQQWIIDPLDGTTWFAMGMPLFGTLVAFLEAQEPVLGVIHFPILDETVYAAKQLGCWFKSGVAEPVRIRVTGGVSIHEAVVSASGLHGSDIDPGASGKPYHLSSVLHQSRKFRFCGDCLQHALVCRGNIHAAIDTIMQPWDIAAIIPCIEEAGGVTSTLSGQREGIVFGGSLLTSCDLKLHNELLCLLQA